MAAGLNVFEWVPLATAALCYYLAILRGIWQRGWLKGLWIIHFCIKQQWSHNFSFLHVNLYCGLSPAHILSYRSVIMHWSWHSSFLLRSVTVLLAGVWSPLPFLHAHVIFTRLKMRVQYMSLIPGVHDLECVCLCSCRVPRHPFGKGTNVLNVSFMQIRKYRKSGLRKEIFSQQPC